MSIEVQNVSKSFGAFQALKSVSLQVETGELIALLGPSGSGKTTVLRVIAGLLRPTTGRVRLGGRDVTAVPAHRRGVGLVFQDAALFPHRDVGGNVGFGPQIEGLHHGARTERVTESLALVGLAGAEARDPLTLSGGEAQRVALARALATRPEILLLDEPLGALDGPLRLRLQRDLRDLFERLSLTVVHVTHDVGEAFALGDRVAILREGRLAQVATPDELWARPADDWVARFLGMRNVTVDGDRATVIRPEAVSLAAGDDATVVLAERDGPIVRYVVRRADGSELEGVSTDAGPPRAGDSVAVEIDPAGIVEVPRWSP